MKCVWVLRVALLLLWTPSFALDGVTDFVCTVHVCCVNACVLWWLLSTCHASATDGTGSVGAAGVQFLVGFLVQHTVHCVPRPDGVKHCTHWNAIFYMLVIADVLAALCLTPIVLKDARHVLRKWGCTTSCCGRAATPQNASRPNAAGYNSIAQEDNTDNT